jgi:hypothetical protein
VFPYSSRRAGHHVERPGFGIDREAIPGLSGASAESKLASGFERQTEYLVEVRLVAVPADANSHAVFGTENLLNAGFPASVSLHVCNDFRQPAGDRFSALQLAQVVVVAEAEHGHPPFPFKLAELKGLKREAADSRNKFLFDSRRNEVCSVAQSFWLRTHSIKQG